MTRLFVLFCFVGCIVSSFAAVPTTIYIGGLFENAGDPEEKAFDLGITAINNDPAILAGVTVVGLKNYTNHYVAAFDTMQHTCWDMSQSVVAMIGPMSSTNVKAAHPLTSGFHIPLIAPAATDPMLDNADMYPYLIRMFGSDKLQSKAIVDFMRKFRFNTMAMLTDNSDYGVNGLIEFQAQAAFWQWRILSTQQFEAVTPASGVDATAQLQNIKSSGAKVVILNTNADHAQYIFDQAYAMGMMGDGWMWFVTDGVTAYNTLPTLLATKPWLEGVIGSRPVVENGNLYNKFLIEWASAGMNPDFSQTPAFPISYYDAVYAVARGLNAMVAATSNLSPAAIDCLSSPITPWADGASLFNYIKGVNADGAMHKTQFDANGGPVDVAFNYVRLTSPANWTNVGNWTTTNPSDGTLLTDIITLKTVASKRVLDIRDFVGDIANQTLKIVTILEPPFVRFAEKQDKCRYKPLCLEGFCIDLIDKLADELNFTYTLELVTDRKYGIRDTNGKWNGLVSQLIEDEFGNVKYDMALGPLTISAEREKVMSFTKPFRDLQMAILVGYKEQTEYNPFSFLVPFEPQLWLYIMLTAFAIGVFLAIVDKLSPYGHHGKKVQNESEDEFEEMDINEDGTIDEWERRNWLKEKEAMNFHNAVFWSFASFFEQGGEYHPRAWSGRIVAGAWWFGIVIIISTYTANLAAFLTIKTPKVNINNLQELAVQAAVKYTTLSDTEVYNFFKSHTKDPYVKMYNQMDAWIKTGNQQGVTVFPNSSSAFTTVKSLNGSLALLTDQPLAEYWKGQACTEMRLIGTGFGNIGYGLGLPINSKYREELSIKILKLREMGFIDQLDYKWITKLASCAAVSQVDSSGGQIELASMLGVFYVIYAGFAVALVILVLEWIVSCFSSIDRDHPRKPNSFCEALADKFHRLKVDFLENWFPCKLTNSEESLKLFSVKRDIPGVKSSMVSRAHSPGAARRQGQVFPQQQQPVQQMQPQMQQQPMPPQQNAFGIHNVPPVDMGHPGY